MCSPIAVRFFIVKHDVTHPNRPVRGTLLKHRRDGHFTIRASGTFHGVPAAFGREAERQARRGRKGARRAG